jgi:hypothetical protein
MSTSNSLSSETRIHYTVDRLFQQNFFSLCCGTPLRFFSYKNYMRWEKNKKEKRKKEGRIVGEVERKIVNRGTYTYYFVAGETFNVLIGTWGRRS